MPVLEAGLTGLPVFSAPIPASVELGGGSVHVFQPDDAPEAIAARILEWAETDPIHQMKKKTRQGFTWQAIFQQQILPLISNGTPG